MIWLYIASSFMLLGGLMCLLLAAVFAWDDRRVRRFLAALEKEGHDE